MNKKQYLDALGEALRHNQVADIQDILDDYKAHFAQKTLDGYTEEEIARKLGSPDEIAADFLPAHETTAPLSPVRQQRYAGRRIALCNLDIFAGLLFLLLFCWALTMGLAGLGTAAVGAYLITGSKALAFVPYMPMPGSLLTGCSFLALASLLITATVWFFLFARQFTRSYYRWHSNLWYGRHELPVPAMPQLTGKPRRVMRRTVLWTLLLLVVSFAAAFCVMSIQAGTVGFWHAWQWFQ